MKNPKVRHQILDMVVANIGQIQGAFGKPPPAFWLPKRDCELLAIELNSLKANPLIKRVALQQYRDSGSMLVMNVPILQLEELKAAQRKVRIAKMPELVQ